MVAYPAYGTNALPVLANRKTAEIITGRSSHISAPGFAAVAASAAVLLLAPIACLQRLSLSCR